MNGLNRLGTVMGKMIRKIAFPWRYIFRVLITKCEVLRVTISSKHFGSMESRIWKILAIVFIFGGSLLIFISIAVSQENESAGTLVNGGAIDQENGRGLFAKISDATFVNFITGLITPIFSLAGIFLLFATLSEQGKIYRYQLFESKFLELLRYQRENTAKMNMKIYIEEKEPNGQPKGTKVEKTIDGVRCFVEFKKHFEAIYKMAEEIRNGNESDKLSEKKSIRLAASILLYGVDEITSGQLRTNVNDVDDDLVEAVIKNCREMKSNDDSTYYYGNNQARLASYFSNLYHLIDFVDSSKFLSSAQKDDYVRTVRSQLNQYESAVLFVHSFTQRGRGWRERGHMEKYKIIRDMPQNFIYNIEPKNYYDIQFEYEK